MTFENPLFLIPAICGLSFLFAGLLMLKFPPKKINVFYGYRTTKSMKNQEVWDFAQRYSAKAMIKYGAFVVAFGLVGLVYFPSPLVAAFIGAGISIAAVIVLIVNIESAIKRKFESDS